MENSSPKKQMLDQLFYLREQIELGEVISLVSIPVGKNDKFEVMYAGETKYTTIAGILARAHLDLLLAM